MEQLTDRAVGWLQKQEKGEPFFLYFAPVAVHELVTPSIETKGTSKAGPYGDFIHDLDLSVGRILKESREIRQRRRQSAYVSRLLKRLHVHGFIAKIPRSRRWRITSRGQQVLGAALEFHHAGFFDRFKKICDNLRRSAQSVVPSERTENISANDIEVLMEESKKGPGGMILTRFF